MDEAKFANLARQYIGFIDRQQTMKPPGWSQADHTAEYQWRIELLDQMRAALGARQPTYQDGLGQYKPGPGQ